MSQRNLNSKTFSAALMCGHLSKEFIPPTQPNIVDDIMVASNGIPTNYSPYSSNSSLFNGSPKYNPVTPELVRKIIETTTSNDSDSLLSSITTNLSNLTIKRKIDVEIDPFHNMQPINSNNTVISNTDGPPKKKSENLMLPKDIKTQPLVDKTKPATSSGCTCKALIQNPKRPAEYIVWCGIHGKIIDGKTQPINIINSNDIIQDKDFFKLLSPYDIKLSKHTVGKSKDGKYRQWHRVVDDNLVPMQTISEYSRFDPFHSMIRNVDTIISTPKQIIEPLMIRPVPHTRKLPITLSPMITDDSIVIVDSIKTPITESKLVKQPIAHKQTIGKKLSLKIKQIVDKTVQSKSCEQDCQYEVQPSDVSCQYEEQLPIVYSKNSNKRTKPIAPTLPGGSGYGQPHITTHADEIAKFEFQCAHCEFRNTCLDNVRYHSKMEHSRKPIGIIERIRCAFTRPRVVIKPKLHQTVDTLKDHINDAAKNMPISTELIDQAVLARHAIVTDHLLRTTITHNQIEDIVNTISYKLAFEKPDMVFFRSIRDESRKMITALGCKPEIQHLIEITDAVVIKQSEILIMTHGWADSDKMRVKLDKLRHLANGKLHDHESIFERVLHAFGSIGDNVRRKLHIDPKDLSTSSANSLNC